MHLLNCRSTTEILYRVRGRTRRAFTLVEAMVVICLLGLFASSSLLLLSGPMKRAQHQAAYSELTAIDEWARVHSRRGSVTLRVDLGNQFVEAFVISRTNERSVLKLPPGLQVTEVLVGGVARDSGTVELSYANGGCPTHALLIASASGQHNWTVIGGPTGERYLVKNDELAEKQLRAWFTHWTHPD